MIAALKELRLVIPELPYSAGRAGFTLIEIPGFAGEVRTWNLADCSPQQAATRLRELAVFIEQNTIS